MSPENEDKSLFFRFKKAAPKPAEAAAPAPAPKPAAAPASKATPLPAAHAAQSAPAAADLGKTEALEAAVNEIKAKLAALTAVKQEAPPPLPPPVPPPPAIAPLDDLKRELAAASEGVSRAVEAEAGLAVRMERAENLIAELKVLVSSQQAQLNKYAEQKVVSDGLSEYLRDLVARMNARVTEAENTMHVSLSDLSARLTGNEAVYGRMFSDAESRLKKTVGGEITALDAQTKRLRESVVWLADEYKIVMERKIRALEGRYSAFEAIARRMDTIDAALKKGGKIGPD